MGRTICYLSRKGRNVYECLTVQFRNDVFVSIKGDQVAIQLKPSFSSICQKKVTIPDPALVKKILSLHKFDPQIFQKPSENDKPFFADRENIALAENKSLSKKLRMPFTNIVGTKSAQVRVNKIVSVEVKRAFQGIHSIEALDCVTLAKRIVLAVAGNGLVTEIQERVLNELLEKIRQPDVQIQITKRELELFPTLWKEAQDRGLKESQQIDSLWVFLSVAFGNCASGLTKLVHVLNANPSVLPEVLSNLSFESDTALACNTYVLSVVAESLRICPVINEIGRRLSPDQVTYGDGKACPYKKLNALIDLKALANNPAIVGKKPEEFSVDRECYQNIRSVRNLPFLSFGAGIHQCPCWWLYQVLAEHVVVAAASLNQ